MAAGPLLISEPLQRYRALGLAGDPVWRAAGQLRAAIAAAAVARACRSAGDPRGRSHGPPHRLVRAVRRRSPTPGRCSARPNARRCWTRSSACTATWRGWPISMEAPERSSAERNFARLLRHALTAPGEETLYVVDGKPVMTFWGFTADASLPGAFLASPPVPAAPVRAIPEAVMASAPALVAGRPAHELVAVAAAGAAPAADAGAASPGWCGPTCRVSNPISKPKPANARSSLSVRQPLELQQTRVEHAAAGQREPAARAGPPHRRSGAARRRLRGRHHRTGRRRSSAAVAGAPIERGAAPEPARRRR